MMHATSLYVLDDEEINSTLACTSGFFPHTDAGRIAARLSEQRKQGCAITPADWDELQDAINMLDDQGPDLAEAWLSAL